MIFPLILTYTAVWIKILSSHQFSFVPDAKGGYWGGFGVDINTKNPSYWANNKDYLTGTNESRTGVLLYAIAPFWL